MSSVSNLLNCVWLWLNNNFDRTIRSIWCGRSWLVRFGSLTVWWHPWFTQTLLHTQNCASFTFPLCISFFRSLSFYVSLHQMKKKILCKIICFQWEWRTNVLLVVWLSISSAITIADDHSESTSIPFDFDSEMRIRYFAWSPVNYMSMWKPLLKTYLKTLRPMNSNDTNRFFFRTDLCCNAYNRMHGIILSNTRRS